MDDFDIDGFLGTQIISIREDFLEKYRYLFSFAEELNRFAISQVYFITFKKNTKDMIIGSLFCKCITSYQSTILILSYGLPNEAEVLLRSLMESTFILHACLNEDEYYKEYLKSHDFQRFEFAKKIISNKLAIDLTQSFTAEEINNAKNNYKKFQKYKLNFREISKKARLEYYYLTHYFTLSITTHNLPRSLEHYIYCDKSNELFFDIIPKLDDDIIKFIIMLSSDLLLKTLDKLNNYYKLNFNGRIKAFYDKLNSL